MNTFSEGDLIEASKGDTVIRGRVINEGTRMEIVPWCAPSIPSLTEAGFTLTLIEKAVPALPTEPGWYLDVEEDIWALRGRWWKCLSETVPDLTPEEYLPLTRLEPVADTAKKVLDALRAVSHGDGGYYEHQLFERQFRDIATKFGVTE